MRTLPQLLQVMIDHIHMIENKGLCHLSVMLFIKGYVSPNECMLIDRYLDDHELPGLYSGPNSPNAHYWWPPGETEPRKIWLTQQIESLPPVEEYEFTSKQPE